LIVAYTITGSGSRRPARDGGGLVDLAQLSVLDLIDKATHVLVGDERACLDAADRLAYVLVEVFEGLDGPLGLDAGVVLDGLVSITL
jgi:hypothetical protein